jgi:hypothetical protein
MTLSQNFSGEIYSAVAPLVWSDTLYSTAKEHSDDMAETNSLIGYDGSGTVALLPVTISAVDWAYDSGANQYDYIDTMEYFRLGFSGTKQSERRKNQAKMFVSLGHMIPTLNNTKEI